MRVLVTGGAGFIGANFIHHLIHQTETHSPAECCSDAGAYQEVETSDGLEVANVDILTYAGDLANLAGVDDFPGYRHHHLDIRDRDGINTLVKDFQPDVIIHFAAESHVDRSIAGGDVFVSTNVLGTQILLEAARRHDVPRFIQVSTDEVYGSLEEGSATESSFLDPSSPYSASKASGDLLALAHARTYGLPVIVTRCTNNYGPRQHTEKLIPLVISKALADERIPVYGSGEQSRDWLYVKDHCAAIALLTKEPGHQGIFNIGASWEPTNLETIGIILEALHKPKSLIEHVTDRAGHDQRYSVDSSRIRALGWEPQVDFTRGLSLTIEWYQSKMAPGDSTS